MRVCIVSHEFEPFPGGGIATYHNAAARVMAAAGHEVHFVTNAATHGSADEHHGRKVWREGNLTVHRLPLFDETRKIPLDAEVMGVSPIDFRDRGGSWAADASNIAALRVADYVRDLHRSVRLDLIEAPEFFGEAYYMIRARRSGRVEEFPPICIHGHTSSRRAFRTNRHFWDLGYHPHRVMMLREEYCLQFADALLTPSRSLMAAYEQQFADGLPALRAVSPYFLELERERPSRLPSGIEPGLPFLLCVGRVEPRKGSDLAVRAFAELANDFPDLRLVFLGKEVWHHGEVFDDVLGACLPKELHSRVLRPGNVSRGEVLACMAAAQAFLHPAPWDNYPCAVLEAMSVGAICVLSDNGGQAEMVEPGVSGLLHRSEDAAHLVQMVRSVLSGAIDSDAMRSAARSRSSALTAPERLLADRQALWAAMVAIGKTGNGRKGRARNKQVGVSRQLPVAAGLVVVDAGGEGVGLLHHTELSLRDQLPSDGSWQVVVLVDSGTEPELPAGWSCQTTIDPPRWLESAPNVPVVWLIAGVQLDPDRLSELLRLALDSPLAAGSFAWLTCKDAPVFPYSPDLGSEDALLVGRPLPAALVVRSEVLHPCNSLSGLSRTDERVATLLAVACSGRTKWLRHTATTVGAFHGRLPMVTEDVQAKALGYLDTKSRISPGITQLGTAAVERRAVKAAVPPAPPTLPQWLPPTPEVVRDGGVAAEPVGAEVSSLGALELAIESRPPALVWPIGADNWFDLILAAKRCADAGVRLELTVATSGATFAELPEADLVAVYQCIRDWWPWLAGAERVKSLGDEAYNGLATMLRDLVHWRAEQSSRGIVDGVRRLALPSSDHELLTDEIGALRLLRPFLALDESRALDAFVDQLVGRPDLHELVRMRVWSRILLLHRLWRRWDAKAHAALHELYADASSRGELQSSERSCCREAGLEWWWNSVWGSLGLDSAWHRERPFAPGVAPADVDATAPASVTVLIPSYRHEGYVAEAVRSALAQTMRGVQVLVVDDQSPDRTVAAARSVVDPRLEVRVNRSNLGLGNSILAALKGISTPYVAILNSDDVLHPSRLERCVGVLDEESCYDLVCTGLALVDRDGGRIDSSNVSAWHDGRNVRDWVHWYERSLPASSDAVGLFRELLQRNFLVTSSNIVCRTDWLREQADSLAGLKYCLDWQLFLTAALHGRLKYLPEPLLAYRLHPNNTVWFDRSNRWAYTLEVSRVAVAAVRSHAARTAAGGSIVPREVLRDLIDALRANTEVDWPAMLANELVGGGDLEAASRNDHELVEMLRRLLVDAPGSGGATTEQRRASAAASKARVLGDEVHVLRARHRWSSERLSVVQTENRSLASTLEGVRGELQQRERRLGAVEVELGARTLDRDEQRAAVGRLQQRCDQLSSRLDSAGQELERISAERARSEAELLVERQSVATLQAALRGLEQRYAVLEAECSRLRAELGGAIAEMNALTATAAATARSLEAVWAEGAAAREALVGKLVALHKTDGVLPLGGFRVQPGSTSEVVRRMRKFGRKFGAAIAAIGGSASSRLGFEVVHLAEHGIGSPTDGALLASFRVTRWWPVDANSPMPQLPIGVEPTIFFPEHGPALLRKRTTRMRLDADSWLERFRVAAVIAERNPVSWLGETAHLAQRLAACGAATLVTSGALPWHLRMSFVAELSGRPWIAIVDRVDSRVDAVSMRRLATAQLVVARSGGIAEALVAGGVDAGRVVIAGDRPAPGLFAADRPDDGTVLLFGDCDEPRTWSRCLSGFAIAAAEDPRLRLRIVGGRGPAGETATEMLVRETVAAWPRQPSVEFYPAGFGDWSSVFTGRPSALVWTGGGEHVLSPAPAVVLAAVEAGIPLAPVESAGSRDLFGALGVMPWIPRTGVLEVAAAIRALQRPAARYGTELVQAALRELASRQSTQRVAERVRAVVSSAPA